MDIRAKLAALKNAGKSPADSKTPARSGANAFGRMMEGGAPFTFPESTPWPTDENMGDVSSKIKDLKDKAGAIPTTSSSITQGDGSSAGNLVFGGKKRDQQPADINIGQPGDLVFGGKKDESTTTRKAADQVLREAEELAGAKDAGFLKGVASGFDAVDTFTAGLAKSSRKNAQVLTTRNIEKKIKAGLPLSNDEQLFVDAVGLRQKADELLEQSGGKSIGYQVGNVTGAMPEFIAQIAMTKGVGDGVGTTMKVIPFIKEGLKAGALKKGTTLAGIELGKAAVVSPLQPMFASAFADQELGQYYVGTDANGEVVAERNNPQSVTASLAKAFAYTLTENWSEGMGEIFGQAGTKLAQGVAKSKLGVRLAGSQLGSLVAKTEETVAKVTGSMGTKADDFGLGGVRAFTKDVLKWNGTLNEIAEEEFNNVVQPLLMGEPEQLKQLIDPEQQLVTALSCAVAGVGFKAIEVPGYVRSGIAIKQNKEAYQESLANLRPEIASQVVAAFGEQDIAARGKALAALPWVDMQPTEREQVVNAAYHKTKYDFLRGAKSASEAEEKLSSIKQKVDFFSFKGVHNFEPSLYAATLDNGVPVTIVDGDIQSYTNADNSTSYLAGKNRKPVVVTADGRRLMVDPIQLNGISRISSAEYTNASIDQFLQQQAVEDDTNDINDAEEDMQVASLQPMLPAAPISEQQATPEIQPTPQQPIAETNTNNDYIPKVSDTVVTPNGYVGKVVQSNMDGAIVSYLDENGDEQIEVVGPNDPIQPYQPAEDELQPAPANLVNDGNGNISQYQPAEDEQEPTISKMETAEVLPVETSNSNTEQQATTETKAAPTVQEEAILAPSYPELAKEISNTVNDEPSVEEPHYVSKNRKYLYTFKNGSLLIMDRNGIEVPPVINGRINPQHTRLSKEYKNVFDYSKGEEGTADGATSEAEAILMLINSSKNPLELANLYLSETARGNDLVRDMEVSVVGVILDVAQSHKVSKDGFEEWSDANNISGTIAKTFFSKDGVNPSDIAALANAQLKGEWDANNEMVTANDVVQAIIDYPRGVQDLERVIKDGTAAKAAHDAFIGITGFAITPAVINRIAAYQTEETPSILSEEELQQQMADDELQARIDAAKQAGIDMAAEQYGLFLEPTLQQNENSNVEQESNISNDELPSTQGTEIENTGNTAEGNNSGEQEGDQGIIQQPEEPNQQEVGLSPTQQSEYDKRKLEIEREITDLTDKLSAARKSKDKAINEAQMRNGLFGDTATDPRQTTIDGGGTLDVLSGVNTISKKHSETISQLSKAIQAKKKELEGLLGAISSQQEIQPQDELIVQNQTTSSAEPTVEEDDKNLAVQNHTTKPEFTFPLERVVKAYSHLHLNPRNSALVEREQLNTIINKLSEAITNHNPNINSEELSSILDNFKHRYVERRERVWNSAQNSYSSAVAGASNFNKRQADKRGSILDREEDSFNKWLNEEIDKVEFAQGIDRKAEQQQKEQQKQEKAQARKVMVVKAWLMLKPGDTVDIGNPSGNPTIKKKNKFSLETNSGVKWTLKQITGIDHEEAKTIMDQIEADNIPLTTTAENNESINSEQATTEETPAATPEEQETPIVAIGSEEAVRKEQEEAFRAKFPLYFKTASSIEKMYNGELTLDEYKQAFKQLQDDKDKIVAELNGNTKDTILRLLGPYERFQYKNDKKENIVNNIYRNLLMNYAFNTISYDFRTTTDVAIANKVEKTTQEQLNSFVDDVRKQREEYKKEQELKKKALENPETAEEFRIFISKNGIDALNNEQLAAWDKIVTQNALNNKESKKAKTAKPEAVAISTNGMSLHETKHTKTGEQLFVVQLPERVSKEEYQAFNSRAKSLGGYYSSYRGNGAIPGFTFKNKSNAEEFMGNTESKTDNEEAQDTTTPSAQKLKELGEKVVENANEALNRDRLTNTVKRASEAEYAEKNARILLRLGQTIINIANGIEAGNVNLLKNIKAKTHVEMLESILGSAKWRHYDDIKKNSSYKDREETLKADPTEEVIRYVKNEYFPRLYKDNLLRMVRSAINVKGMKLLASRLEKSLLSVNSEYVTIKNEQQIDDIIQVVNSLPEKDRISVIEDQLARHRRLKAMGVENESMLREMLREYLNYRAGAIKQDEVKRLERELVGKNVGIDFFPTPKSTVDRMVDEADIREGMDVLEPSAGNGNIADGIRETGVEPDVIEISGALSKVLEAKGYNVVGGDFMDYNDKQYDRIVMNPPFSNSMDAEHIMHAYELLKPGGRIVAISGEGIFFRSDKKSVEFRDWLDSVGGYSEKLPEGTFTDKKLLNTTGVNSRLVIVDKPEEKPLFSRTQTIPETITVDGVERPTTNSEGNVIHTSVEGITNFWRWFGDSKIVDEHGRPKVVYHETNSIWDSYDFTKIKAAKYDYELPTGIFTKPTDKNIGLGKIQMPLYASINNPLYFYNRNSINSYFTSIIPGYHEITTELNKNNEKYDEQLNILKKEIKEKILSEKESGKYIIPSVEWSSLIDNIYKPTKIILEAWNESNNKLSVNAKQLIDEWLKSSEYDGIILRYDQGSWGRETESIVSFNPSQVKSATDNSGTFSPSDDRISYSRKSVTNASEAVKEAKDTAAKLYDSIAETSDSISSQYSVMQHLDGTAQNAIIEAVEPLVKQWSEAENKKQDAVGVLVQTRRIDTELPLLAENLSRVKAPEGGWTTDSAQAFLDDMKSKYPTAGEAIAVENANVAADTILELGYSQYMADKVRNEDWDGVTLPDGRVIIRVDNPNLHISSTWAHEQGHSLISRMFNSKDRMALGEAVCNAIGVHDILDYIGNEYANEPIWLIGEEYLTHRVGSIAKGDSIEAAPAGVEILHNAKNGITPDSVEQIISTLVSQILKNNGKDKSGWNGDDIEIRPRDNASFQQNDNSGSVRAVHEANSGRNDTGSILESNQQGEKHQERVAAAEDLTDTKPSEAQKIAGNYRKGKARVLGMEISIENPKGSTRSGVDPNGKAWSITMPQPYGYILGTVGKDKDHVDVYLGRNLTKDTPVFVVNQVNPSTGAFDEHKVMIGYPTYGSAKRAYMSAYEQGWQGFGSMGEMSLDEFKEWAYSNKTKKEATPTEPTPELADSPEFSSTWHDDDFLGMPTDFGSAIAFARRRGGDVRRPDKNMSLLDGTFDKVREQIQDATLRVRKLQDRIEQSGGKVPFAANAWEALNRYTSAAKAKMDYFENGELNNLITVAGDLCKKVDATWEQLNDYLMCKHGIDRQEVGDVNVFSTVAGSEWTLSNAQQTVKDFESKTTTEDIDKLWLAVREATTASLKALKDGGVISENDMNGYLSREGWQNYVPLRDFDVTDEMKADDVFEYSESRNPQRGTFVKATQTAKGRTSKPNSPIPQIAAMFASSVALAEKNRAKQALLNLVRLNPKREEYTVTRSWYVLDKGTNTTLEVYEKPKPSLIDLQNACIDFFVAPDIQSKNAMVQQLQDMQQAAIDDGADPNLVGLVMRQGMQEGAYTITTKPHKSSILGETKEQDRQHMVAVFEDGVKYVVWMQDPELAAAVNNTNINSKFNETWFGQIMGGMNRWLSVNFTGKNPAFIPINWIRDMQYATLSHLIRHDGETARTYANIGRASMAIHRFNTGNANPLSDEELAGYSMHNPNHMLHLIGTYGKNRLVDTLFMQYRNNGGETGYIHTDDIRTWAKRLRRHLQREMGTNPTVDKLKQAGSKYTGLHAAGRLLDYTAYQSENMTRFATFLAAWESGKGFAEAASDAKNITVNFNRKGRISSILNSIMVFFNATVQGTDNLIDRVIVPNKGRFATAASILFAASILASSMAIAAYGDGDDSPYWRMPEFVRYNSLIVPTYGIGGDEKFLIIPLPPGLRFINGWAAASLEGYYGKKRASEVASAMASSLFDNTSPVGVNGGDLTRTFIPSIAVPFYDIAINKDYAGRPVYREMFTQELRDNTPNSQQGSLDVNEVFAVFTQWLNGLGGGDENLPAGVDRSTGKVSRLKRALLDINPSKIEHVLSYYAGGRGQFFLDCYRTARPTWDSNAELETRNIPVVRRLWGGATAASDAKAFYDRVDNLKRYQYYIDKSFKDGDRKGINESLVNLDVYRWAAMSEAYSEQVRDLSRMADGKSITKDQRKELLERRKLLMRQFLNSTNNYDKITEKLANNE